MATNWFYPFVCVSVISMIYFVFLFINLMPQLRDLEFSNDPDSPSGSFTPDRKAHKATMTEAVLVTSLFHCLFLLLLTSFVRAVLTPPGSIPKIKRWKEPFPITSHDERRVRTIITTLKYRLTKYDIRFVRSLPVVERKQKNGKYRKCADCNVYKPDRCHHCRTCETCVLRMDHHCPWIANCVGFHNYKFFLLLLFYSICCTGFILGAMFPRMLNAFGPVLDMHEFLLMDLPVCVVWALCVAIFSALSVFFTFHFFLVLEAMTTIELKEKKNNEDEFVHHRFYVANLKWNYSDISPYVNI